MQVTTGHVQLSLEKFGIGCVTDRNKNPGQIDIGFFFGFDVMYTHPGHTSIVTQDLIKHMIPE